MNTNKTISNIRKVGGNYYQLNNDKKSNKYLKDFLPLFNFDDYWCYKISDRQKLVNYEDFLEFKYSGYILFRKDLYKTNNIDIWIEWAKGNGCIKFLTKPTPPFNPNKIIIRYDR